VKRLLFGAVILGVTSPLHAEPFCRSVAIPTDRAFTLRANGSGSTDKLDQSLREAFGRAEPGAKISGASLGTTATPALLDFGRVDFGMMGRRITANELIAYKKATQGAPLELRLAHTPAAGAKNVAWSLAVYVSKDNPVQTITLKQLGQIVTAGAPDGDLRTWGQVNAAAAHDKMWRDEPIHIYSTPEYTGFGASVQTLFDRRPLAAGTTTLDNSETILKRLQSDPYGIAIAALGPPPEGLKEVAVQVGSAAPALGTADEIRAGTYPLSRYVYLYAREAPDPESRAKVCSFLRFILSPQGQSAVAASNSGYLPLTKAEIDSERKKID